MYLITLRDRFGRNLVAKPRITRSHHRTATSSAAPSLFFPSFPPSRPVFTFPFHLPELGVDLGLNYCHPLLTTTGPHWVWDLGLDHRHQPLPGSLMKQTSLFINLKPGAWGVTQFSISTLKIRFHFPLFSFSATLYSVYFLELPWQSAAGYLEALSRTCTGSQARGRDTSIGSAGEPGGGRTSGAAMRSFDSAENHGRKRLKRTLRSTAALRSTSQRSARRTR